MTRGTATVLTVFIFLILTTPVISQRITYPDSWGDRGFSVVEENSGEVLLNFSIVDFELLDIDFEGESFKKVSLPGHFLSNDEGAPDLPNSSRYILVPEGAEAEMEIVDYRVESYQNITVLPASRIPMDIDDEPLRYTRDPSIYTKDAFYPASPVMIESDRKIRGMSAALLGIMPFQYNPVTRELLVYRDLKIRVKFKGGGGEFGIAKYRNRYWDPILKSSVMNWSSLPEIDYSGRTGAGSRIFNGCEYLILCPDGADFQQWADSIKQFRTEQGILTEIRTMTEVGGNTTTAIEAFIDNAFNTWDIPPDAVLLLGDHGTDPLNSITSVTLNDHPGGYNPYVSDNVYADVDGDQLPDIAFARITARNAAELELMVHKFMDYERNPPTDPDFYDHPITALGWQTERWFQICSEVVGGFMKNELGKNPVRINAVYEGNPDTDPWSTWSTTTSVLNYFGPSGQNYIPATPSELGGWTGGTASQINAAINSGSFLLQHRDHGYTGGWGEPSYSTSNIGGLSNTDLTFVMSVNCQTGKFDYASETFTEKFHRYQYGGNPSGALGLIAATEVSYSFVNDVYIWGLYDYMWPDFMPTYGSNPDPGGLLPCFGNVAGKYFLQQSSWTGLSATYKEITYRLFHHHGDAYLTLYSEVPQPLTVAHSGSILASQTSFTVTANAGAFVALTCNGEILGTATATGIPQDIALSGNLVPGGDLVVTVTLTNYYRYRSLVTIASASGPYPVFADVLVDDAGSNNNGQLDCGETSWLTISIGNIGNASCTNISATLQSTDTLVQILNSSAYYGSIENGDTLSITDGYQVKASAYLPDGHGIPFELSITDGVDTWIDNFFLEGHSPQLKLAGFLIDDSGENGNGLLDPGETAGLQIQVNNAGSTLAENSLVSLFTNDPLLQVQAATLAYGNINPGDTASQTFIVTASFTTPPGHAATLYLESQPDNGLPALDSLQVYIGKVPALVIDLDPDMTSGPAMVTAIQANGLQVDYALSIPADLEAYSSVFCCLGIYANNHVLTTAEGDLLASYLDGGGHLYMEGGDTWAYDTWTAVHSMFNISGTADGSGDMGTLSGLAGTFTEGMSYTYAGQNSYMDHLSPTSPAYAVLQNNSPSYSTCVVYDQGTYATIGASHEFGGLTDNANTKAQLMGKYLGFFGITVTCEWLGNTTDWEDPDNWSNGLVPDPTTNALVPVIPGGTYPMQFPTGTAGCNSLMIEPGADFHVPAGVVFTIQQ